VIPARLFPILNAVGCVILTGFILLQWFAGKTVAEDLHKSRSQTILETNARIDAEKRARLLQSDVDGLKASIESIQKASELAEKELALKTAQEAILNASLAEAQGKVKEWEEAVKARDEAIVQRDAKLKERDDKLREMSGSLLSTRKRLDEAIAELKQAGAR